MPPKKKNESLGKFGEIFQTGLITSEVEGLASHDPTSLGLPDLLIDRGPKEDADAFRLRQDRTIADFVQESLWLTERGRRKKIVLIPQQAELLADFFYKRINKGIVWKNRGGGGTLIASILSWLCMVWRHFSWVIVAGNAEQAKMGYAYTFQFWENVPATKKLLVGEPLQSMTQLKDGTYLKCLTNSEQSSRSKHPPGLIADEACQDDPRKDKNLEAALQMVLSNEEYAILVLSTFHHARGLFQRLWDSASERGFKRYKWDQFDTLKKCTFGMDRATPKDPKALAVCQSDCPLTVRRKVLNSDGEVERIKFAGCNGRARETNGYLNRDNAVDALRMNDQETAAREHWCERPTTLGPVYDVDNVDEAFSHGDLELTPEEIKDDNKSVGIDWGLMGQTAIIGPVAQRRPDGPGTRPHLAVASEAIFSGDSLEEITGYLHNLEAEQGKFVIYADSSHPFNNLHLQNAGFRVEVVAFGTWKEFGITNLRRWFDHRAIAISESCLELRRCLKAYHRDERGRPVKKDDHAPDGLLCAGIHWIWEQETQPNEDTGDTRVMIYGKVQEPKKREAVVAPPAPVLPLAVSPVTFRLRIGVAWNVTGASGVRYKFRKGGRVTVTHPLDVQRFLHAEELEVVKESL